MGDGRISVGDGHSSEGDGRSSVGDGRSSLWVTVVAQWVTVVAQWAKAPGIHYFVGGSIPAVTPRYCTKKIEKCSLEHQKNKGKKQSVTPPLPRGGGQGGGSFGS
jgi:hypothetical protein